VRQRERARERDVGKEMETARAGGAGGAGSVGESVRDYERGEVDRYASRAWEPHGERTVGDVTGEGRVVVLPGKGGEAGGEGIWREPSAATGSGWTGGGKDAVGAAIRRELAQSRGEGGDGVGAGGAEPARFSGSRSGAQTQGWHRHHFLSRTVGGGGERGREFGMQGRGVGEGAYVDPEMSV